MEISPIDDHRVLRAVQSLCPAGTFRFGSRSAQDERYAKRVYHAPRLTARIRCLQTVTRTRHDSESIEEVDVEVMPSKKFSKWRSSLSEGRATEYGWAFSFRSCVV
ncbi:unnamed protein product [Prorocentrum cordatum]|uniref:Uncharacterized protein n=1 Tax=Prorocentrum cordatum TaxID=2364126 RepID=A0ABN9QNF2_9DINO|nr:unnamed protein product [Polarella glacialis]